MVISKQVAVLKQEVKNFGEKAQNQLDDLQSDITDYTAELPDEVKQSAITFSAEGQALASETKDHIAASAKDVVGKAQEIAGQLVDNPALEAEGLARQAEAKIEHEYAGQ